MTKFGEEDVGGLEHKHHDAGYLDTLSGARKSTWEVYKGQVEEAAKEVKHDEIGCKITYLFLYVATTSL